MGGFGSGRSWRHDSKDTTDGMRSIDVRRWQRDGLLIPGRLFGWQWSRDDEVVASIRVSASEHHVTLTYRHRRGTENDWRDESYPVSISRTACHFGGERPWFICPALACGRRVAILYGGAIFACRYCHQLAYPCQRESDDDRATRRAERIRERLGWEPGILNGEGWKPKGMHWKTFDRLIAEHDSYVNESLAGMAAKLQRLKSLANARVRTA